MLFEGVFGQSSGGSSFGTVKTQATISGAFSGGGGSVQSAGFGGFQKPPTSSPGIFCNLSAAAAAAAKFRYHLCCQFGRTPSYSYSPFFPGSGRDHRWYCNHFAYPFSDGQALLVWVVVMKLTEHKYQKIQCSYRYIVR